MFYWTYGNASLSRIYLLELGENLQFTNQTPETIEDVLSTTYMHATKVVEDKNKVSIDIH